MIILYVPTCIPNAVYIMLEVKKLVNNLSLAFCFEIKFYCNTSSIANLAISPEEATLMWCAKHISTQICVCFTFSGPLGASREGKI